MKKLLSCLILNVLLVSSCATHGPFYVGNPYGAPVSYGEGRHPGIDFDISNGTPIIAASDGDVVYLGEPCPSDPSCGGIFVALGHSDRIASLYGHVTKVFVKNGQSIKRGHLIGLSGASNSGYQHLHFGIYKRGENPKMYSKTYDPDDFWLDGKPRCFDPSMDYSKYSHEKITVPVACGDYAKVLISKTKSKD